MLIFRMFLSQVTFQKSWHGWNRRTMWSRVLSGRSISRKFMLICFRCAMKMSHPQKSTREVSPLGGVTDQDQATNHIEQYIK
ncbi:hypothetical protein Hanom_Chr02g00135501 [Helianthus anomalus]